MLIVITGTPGTGKTVIAKEIAKQFKMQYLGIQELIKEKRVPSSYDKKRSCWVIDPKDLEKILRPLLKKRKNYVIDSHLSHWLFPKKIGLAVVTICPLPILKKRLTKRGYSKEKVRENLDAEIFQICLCEARENLTCPIFVFDTTKSIKPLLDKIKLCIKG